MKIWIIEDEKSASRRISTLIKEIKPDAEITETIDNVVLLKQQLQTLPHPDLIFSDIQLADGISIQVYSEIQPQCPIVFTTAYDHYAVEAFKLNSIHYLLKPIERKGIIDAFDKLEKSSQSGLQNISELFQLIKEKQKNYKENFLFKSGTRLYPVNTEHIHFFYGKEKLVEAFTSDGKRLIASSTLEELESELNPNDFFRANRQFILNRNVIDKIHLSFNGKLKIETKTKAPEEIIISREKSNLFKEWMER